VKVNRARGRSEICTDESNRARGRSEICTDESNRAKGRSACCTAGSVGRRVGQRAVLADAVGRRAVSVLNRQAPSGEGSVSTLNSCRNDCSRQFGLLTGLWTAETRGGAFGRGVFTIAFHFSALRPSPRTKKTDSLATLLMTCPAASHGEHGRPVGSAVRNRVRETQRCVARAHRGVGECGRP